jgi:hypothetical protein
MEHEELKHRTSDLYEDSLHEPVLSASAEKKRRRE